MKKIILLLLITPFLLNLSAQEKRVKSKVVSATVFSQGAQITRVAKFNLEKGENRVVFTNLPPSLDENSIQINCAEATIVSVSNQKNMLDSLAQNPEYIKLQLRKKEIERKLYLENGFLKNIGTEKEVLLSNKELIGDQGVKLEELKLTLTYFKSKLEEYSRSWAEKTETIASLQEELQKVEGQLQNLSTQKVKNTSEVLVTFSAPQPVAATTILKYFTYEAAWYPAYDVRANNINSPLNIVCKANIYQTSGEDWNKVKLSVSSGNPTSGSTAPDIYAWFIDIIQPYKDRVITAYGIKRQAKSEIVYDEVASASLEQKEDSGNSYAPTSISESQTNFTFNIDIPYDIPSKQQPTVAILQTPEVKATYQYKTIPKLSEYAYLVASLTDWQGLNLTNGNANIYFENNYVGNTFLDTKAFGDTLKLSLGKDESVSVKRTKVKSFTEKNLVGSKVTDSRSWEITITNGKKQDIDIQLEDQIPVSSSEKVKVKLVEQGGSDYNASTGIMKWELKLKPSETKKIIFTYSVEYPKGSIVSLE